MIVSINCHFVGCILMRAEDGLAKVKHDRKEAKEETKN